MSLKLAIPDIYKRLLIGSWLAILYFFCIATVVFSLSASLFQEKLNTLSKPNNNNSPTKVYYCEKESFLKKPDTMPDSSPFIKANCIPNNIPTKYSHYTSAEILEGYELWKFLRTKKFNLIQGEDISIKITEQEGEIKKIGEEILKINNNKNNKDEKYAKEKTEDLKLDLELINSNLETLDAAQRLAKEFKDGRLTNIFAEIDHFETFFSPISSILKISTFGLIRVEKYWSFPQPILKINLVLSMGILGSLIFVTIEFIKEPKGELTKAFTMYFFRPFLGMIIALAMYVMVKSGQSTLFEDMESNFSPFFISFLGIISGMLAEQAYRRLSFTGKAFFDDGKDDNESQKSNDQKGGV